MKMPTLSNDLRNLLRRAIEAARVEAEHGSRQALESLAVHHHEPHGSMDPKLRTLRKRLRAHGRQLGDTKDEKKGTQTIHRLVREMAYEHWHRMLFARFLAENHLLIEPTSRVAVSLDECVDLAHERDTDPWVLAASFAASMLPAIFRPDDPVLAVTLPPERRQNLHRLVADLPPDIFTAGDALGWTYQFWQSAEKEAVNRRTKSGEKITGETLPAVTQLFTEPYMVHFLLHNTLGAWHAAKVLAQRSDLAKTAASEAELRAAVALDTYDFDYLRFVRDPVDGDTEGQPTGPWRPAAGAFLTWPTSAAAITVLDPCCGSGHFLVEAVVLLTRLRMAEEALPLETAMKAVLEQNLFGLELDARCTQIAAFNLALTAWRAAGSPIDLPPLSVACSGLGPNTTKEEWITLAEQAAAVGGMPVHRDLFGVEDSLLGSKIRSTLEAVYDLFAQAPELGSLINPQDVSKDLFTEDYTVIEPLLAVLLRDGAGDAETHERAVAAQGMAKAAEILVGPPAGYTLIITNVPYLGRGDHSDLLKEFADTRYKEAKADLATIFVARILKWLGSSGTCALVTPQNWLFLTSYRKLREKLLRTETWNVVARLGSGAFGTIGGHVVNVALIEISRVSPSTTAVISGVDASASLGPSTKAALLRGDATDELPSPDPSSENDAPATDAPDTDNTSSSDDPAQGTSDGRIHLVSQAEQLKNPDARVLLRTPGTAALLSSIATYGKGSTTGDSPRFLIAFWEVASIKRDMVPWLDSPTGTEAWSGRTLMLTTSVTDTRLTSQNGCRIHGQEVWGRPGVVVNKIGRLDSCLYGGEVFDDDVGVLSPNDRAVIPAIRAYCLSGEYHDSVRQVDQALKVTAATLIKVGFALGRWTNVAIESHPFGLPDPQSNDPTQWLFHGHPAGTVAAGPASASPMEIADPAGAGRHPSLICRAPNPAAVLQVAVARLLGYRWPAETDTEMRLDLAMHAWVDRCAPLQAHADHDGIVCLSPVRGELSAADRLRRLLADAFGPHWSTTTEAQLLAAAAPADETPATSIEEWLRDRFFEDHAQLFHHRPFVWHVWDGRKDGFHVLLNYHRLAEPNGVGRRTLEAVTYTQLGEWIDRQRAEVAEKKDGADGRLIAALTLQSELTKILAGEPPYDIFVRWKPLHEQPLGWDPDINDGVRLNIRPFLSAKDVGKKGAGILRWKPNVKWTKDRGQEPVSLRPRPQFPWFWGADPEAHADHRTNFGSGLPETPAAGNSFDGKRWNDLHYSRAAKEAARDAHRTESNS